MRVELGRQSNPRFITSLGSPVRRTRITPVAFVPSVFAKATPSGADGTGCSVASLSARRSTRLPSSSWVAL
jgi:hypothetical protein